MHLLSPHTRANQTQGRTGFTLIEAMVAMAVVAIILPVAMQGVSLALALGSDARHRAEAATLARSKLNELAVTGSWRSNQLAGDFDAAWPAYHWTASVQNWNDGTVSELDVAVSWTARQRSHAVVVGTLVNPLITPGTF